MPPDELRARLRDGLVIPAHPLALTAAGGLDERSQRALTRYYHAAGAGGIAVGVHTTQFGIRDPQHALLRPVLELVAETASACDRAAAGARTLMVAGVCGGTRQAVAEAALGRELGYDAGLLSLAALGDAGEDELVAHARRVAQVIPVVGFYLQPAVGGRLLSARFWHRFAEIPEVVAIKVAPFNRYQTLDVVAAVAASGRAGDIALYTGNDDSIVVDLLTEFEMANGGDGSVRLHFAGGLLGQWACWTERAVSLFGECRRARRSGTIPSALLTQAAQVTEANAALFDAANGFAGCIPGIHYVLQNQGLMAHARCLRPDESLSPGQAEAIDRVRRRYPWMTDDAFVEAHLDGWLS
ncbi:dihydrodipicolinate synthase family protein [soil metagenome]